MQAGLTQKGSLKKEQGELWVGLTTGQGSNAGKVVRVAQGQATKVTADGGEATGMFKANVFCPTKQ